VLLVQPDPLEKTVPLQTLVQLESRVQRAQRDQVLLAQLEKMVLLQIQVQLEKRVQRVPQVRRQLSIGEVLGGMQSIII
jgi:hypothetical protein